MVAANVVLGVLATVYVATHNVERWLVAVFCSLAHVNGALYWLRRMGD